MLAAGSGRFLAEEVQLDGYQGEALAQVVVQFTRKSRPLSLLGIDQSSAQAQRGFLRLPSPGDIHRGTPHQYRLAFAELDSAL
jgi:hypothetical protein